MGFDPGAFAAVSAAETADGRWTLGFGRPFLHPAERTWELIATPAGLSSWAPYTSSRDLSAPGEATLTMIGVDPPAESPATVTVAEPPSVLEHAWGADVLRWEVSGTRLSLLHTMTGRDDLPKMAAGWHLCLLVADSVLAGRPMTPIRGMDALKYGWQELHDVYASLLWRPGRAPTGVLVG